MFGQSNHVDITKGQEGSTKAKVKISKYNYGMLDVIPLRKIKDYTLAVANTYELVTSYHAGTDPNAFHNMLVQRFKEMQPDDFKVMEIPVFSPSISNPRFCQRVFAFGNPAILQELRKIRRAENSNFDDDSSLPRIHGGRPFGGVLSAIGMGILSAPEILHKAFIFEMLEVLGITAIDKTRYQSNDDAPEEMKTRNQFKQHFMDVVIDETNKLIDQIENNIANPEFKIDFRLYALTIFLKGFYREKAWDAAWISELSSVIEDVSNAAFTAIMNPYSDLEALEKDAADKLAPYIDEIMQLKQSYLSTSYIEELERTVGHNEKNKILREIIISLLFAGGDNIKKYLDHVMVEFGNDEVRKKYLSGGEISQQELHLMITEVGRLYPVIYAQPGKALDDFVIEYEKGDYKRTIYVRKGDELHFTTFQANVDEMEWGADAKRFDPMAHASLYRINNATGLFGGHNRRCRGQSVTLSIIHHFIERACERFEWTAKVDNQPNHHPTEFNFNYGVKGSITYDFMLRENKNALCIGTFPKK